VKNVIRVGTAGGLRADVKIRDIIIASAASTTSAINRTRFMGYDYAPTADFTLVKAAYDSADKLGLLDGVRVGPILSTDQFYGHDEGLEARFAEYGVLAVEMEAAGMYTVCPKLGARALTIITISDNLVTGEATTAQERQETFQDMMKVALETALMIAE